MWASLNEHLVKSIQDVVMEITEKEIKDLEEKSEALKRLIEIYKLSGEGSNKENSHIE